MADHTRGWQGRVPAECRKSLDSFGGAPELTTDAYIVWALLQAGEDGAGEGDRRGPRGGERSSDDSYVLALAANICELAKDGEGEDFMAQAREKAEQGRAAWTARSTSITRSGGQALAIETTALASLAWHAGKGICGQCADVDAVPGGFVQGRAVWVDAVDDSGAQGDRGV